MRKLFVFVLLVPILFMAQGCSSSSSGGDESPAADYSGLYYVTYNSTSADAVLQIMQDGSSAALSFTAINSTSDLITMLGNTGIGKVRGRSIDITWSGGQFTRLNFSTDGKSFNTAGDVSFAGVKE